MRRRSALGLCIAGVALAGTVGTQLRAQEVEDRALLPWIRCGPSSTRRRGSGPCTMCSNSRRIRE